MLSLTVPTIFLSLAASALAVTQVKYVREGGSHPDTPDATVSAPSRIACSAKCTALGKCQCTGFWYLTNGTCLLYKSSRFNTTGTSTPKDNSTSEKPAIYRRPAPPSACPGNTSDPCGCPDGFTRCAGRCLQLLPQRVNYTEAEEMCADLGAHLATPRSEEEQQCAAAEMVANYHTWLGFRGGRMTEPFVGADGCGDITFSNWETGHPREDADEGFVSMHPYTGRWYDDPCSYRRYVLCQLLDCYRPDCCQ